MSELKLGNHSPDYENNLIGKKDAIHIAVVGCLSKDDLMLKPGQRVRFTGNAFSEVRAAEPGEQYHGVVDPFLTSPADEGLFVVIIKPGLASAVRHDYDLNISDIEESGQWDCRGCD